MNVWLVLYTETYKDWVEIIQVCSTQNWAYELALSYNTGLGPHDAGEYYVEEWPVNEG